MLIAYLLPSIAIVAVLILFFLHGRKTGLFMALCSLAAFFVSLFGARLLSAQLAPLAADAMTPYFTSLIEEQVDSITDEQLDAFLSADDGDSNLLADILGEAGTYEPFRNSVRNLLEQQTLTDRTVALARSISQVLAGVVIFILAFILLKILWGLLSKTLNLATKLPVIRSANGLLGGVFGLVQGALLLFFLAWLLQMFGVVIPTEFLDNSPVLKFFMTTNILSFVTVI